MSGHAPESLADLQALFWDAIRHPTGVADFLAQASEETRRRFERSFVGDDAMSAVARMEIYANAYYWRLHSVLAENHPVTAWWMGDLLFRNLVTDYVLHHPSRAPDLAVFGGDFATFVGRHPDARERPQLSACAEIEAQIHEQIRASDPPILRAETLRARPPETWSRLVFRLSPTLAIFEPDFDFSALRAAWKAGQPPPASAPAPKAPGLVVWRKGFAVRHRPTTGPELAALRDLERGTDFDALARRIAARIPGEAADADPDAHADPAQRLSRWLMRWIDDEFFVDLDTPP